MTELAQTLTDVINARAAADNTNFLVAYEKIQHESPEIMRTYANGRRLEHEIEQLKKRKK